MVVGKKRCSWERRKERDEEREQCGEENDEVAKEHKSASLKQSESFTQQMYCHGSGTRKYIPALSLVSFTMNILSISTLSASLTQAD